LVPIARISQTVIVVSVPASLGVNSLKELDALAREKPGQLNWTTAPDSLTLCSPDFCTLPA
jgi:tripartite-type tricarboxylate transporter receptor subunit TctC